MGGRLASEKLFSGLPDNPQDRIREAYEKKRERKEDADLTSYRIRVRQTEKEKSGDNEVLEKRSVEEVLEIHSGLRIFGFKRTALLSERR